MSKEERELLSKVKEGDDEAFRQLYDQHIEYALRRATAITKSKYLASEAVQETFIRVYRNISSYDIERPFEAWFYRILINECKRLLTSKDNKVNNSEYLEDMLEHSCTDLYKCEENQDLYIAIQSLDDINRIPIILKYLKDLPEKEIAEILDINVNTIKSRLYKGRQKLKEMLSKISKGGDLEWKTKG